MVEKKEDSVDRASGGGRRDLSRPAAAEEKLCYTVPEAGALLGFSRNHSYELARRGELPILRFGKRMVVPKVAFKKLLGMLEEKEEY